MVIKLPFDYQHSPTLAPSGVGVAIFIWWVVSDKDVEEKPVLPDARVFGVRYLGKAISIKAAPGRFPRRRG